MSVEPSSPLYHSPWGLLGFQQEGVLKAYFDPVLAVWDTGLGKGHLVMATNALLVEDGEIDIHLLVCEQNKIDEWLADYARFTDIEAIPYGGENQTITHRRRIMDAIRTGEPTQVKRGWTIEKPQVLVATYETYRNDLMVKTKVRNPKGRLVEKEGPGPLSEVLSGKRVLVSYDEITKIGNRSTGIHKAQVILLKHLAKTGGQARLIGLTAMPMERDPENFYNIGRILCPADVGTVASFEQDHVVWRDPYGVAKVFKNLSPEDTREPWVTPLSAKMGKVIIRKRWTDDDVRERFPQVDPEKYIPVRLGERHMEFYETVRDVFLETAKTEDDDRALFMLLRQIAGLPVSILYSTSKYAKTIVSEVGVGGLEALGSAKLDMLSARLKPIVLGQGAQAVVFTFFGPSMIPFIAERLEDDGMSVAQNFPDMGPKRRREHLAEFKEGQRRIFLSSDAGARGINLPQASYAFEYESAVTHANRIQRLNRTKRLDSRDHGVERIVFETLIAKDTVEDPLFDAVLRRNVWADALLDDDDPGDHFMTAEQRRPLIKTARRRS